MKKFIIFIFTFLFFIQIVFAHPLDISVSFFSFNKNYLNVTTYFHSYEIEYLLSKSGINTKSVYEYYDHEVEIKDYITKNIKLKSGNQYCKIEQIEMLQLEEYQILSKWFEINYHFKCDKDISNWQIEVYFFDNFPLQTNRISIYNLNDKTISTTPIFTSVLNSNVKIYSFDLSHNFKKCVVDTDWDWISDKEELVYKTDINNIDTDADNFTDYEEIFNSQLPLDKHMWVNQIARLEIPKHILDNIAKNKKTKEICEKEDLLIIENKNINTNWILTNTFWNKYFADTLENIWKYLKWKSENNLIYILLVVVWLWFMHGMWPWHSKSLLISYILDKNKDFFDGLLYITIFTVTHLIDIILLFLLTKVFLNFYDISSYMLYIQRISLVILLFFSIYLIYKSFNKNNENCSTNFKWTFMVWFISGLAPCTFGWSIFLLLFSIWKIWLIIPMIVSLWIWIFLCLFVIMILTLLFRKKVFEKINLFAKYSSIISSIILFILSIYLMFNLF